jgi:hypothetical protein
MATRTGDQPTRVARDLLDAAAAEGKRESRSAKQQLDHWARVGRSVSLLQTASRRRIDAVLTGALPMAALRPDERTVVNAELDAAISARAQSLSFGDVLAHEGVTTVALDEHGALIQYHPDGTSVVLHDGPMDGPLDGPTTG